MRKQGESLFGGGSNITANGDCSHEIKSHLLLGRKAMTNLDSILKSRDITLLTNVRLVKGFSSSQVWIWELDYKESWALKNWCFWAMVLEKTLKSPLDCKEIQPVNPKGNQSFHWKDWCWSWNSNNLGTWFKELTHWKKTWCWERLKVREGDNRGWDGWMASPAQWTWVWASSGSWWETSREAWHAAVHGIAESDRTDWLNWTGDKGHSLEHCHLVIVAIIA